MEFTIRRWGRTEDINTNNTLFTGRLLEWINEQIGLSTVIQLKNTKFTIRHISGIHFLSPVRTGDIVVAEYEKTSVTFRGEARNYLTKQTLLTIEKVL